MSGPNGLQFEVGEVQSQGVVLIVKEESKTDSSILEIESLTEGCGVVGLSVGLDVDVPVAQIYLLVALGSLVAAGCPIVSWLVFELLGFAAIKGIVEYQFAKLASP